ncbi:MAG: hypothetical protein WCF12_02150 [Propionicimonas sp.]
MMSYPVTDRDRERLVHDLDLLTQVDDQRTPSGHIHRRHWFPRTLATKHSLRLATSGSGGALS